MANYPHETIAAYIGDITKRLRRGLPRDKADSAIGEAEAHLQDRAAQLEATGVPRSEAERIAVAGFGSAREFSRAVIAAAFDDRFSQSARWVAAILGMALIIFVTALFNRWFVTPMWLISDVVRGNDLSRGAALFLCAVFVFSVAAFLGKRPQTGLFALCSALAMAISFLNGGLNFIYSENVVARRDISLHAPDPEYLADVEKDIRILETGKRAYVLKSEPVSEILMFKGKYIVPKMNVYYPPGSNTDDMLRLEPTPKELEVIWYAEDVGRAQRTMFRKKSYLTVDNFKSAEATWTSGDIDAQTAARRVALMEYDEGEKIWGKARQKLSEPFSWVCAWNQVSLLLMLCPLLLALDAIAALCGRAAFRLARNRRVRQ